MSRLKVKRLRSGAEIPSQVVLDSFTDIVLVTEQDQDGLVFANQQAREFWGWTHEEITNFRNCWRYLLDEESCESLVKLLGELTSFEGEESDEFDRLRLTAINSTGLHRPFHLHGVLVYEQTRVLLATSRVRKAQADEVLRQTQARFRSIVDSLSINLILKDRDSRRIYANSAYLKLKNCELGDLIGKSDHDIFPAELADKFTRDDQIVLAKGEVIHKFEQNFNERGETIWTESIKGPIRDADNQITGVQVLFWDATTRKSTEQELTRERYLLRALLDNVPDSIYFKDKNSKFVRVSRGMAEKFQLDSAASVIGKSDADIFTVEHAMQARNDELHIMRTGKPIIASVERETWPDKDDTWCSTTKLPLRDAEGDIVGTFGISRDITGLIEVENELRKARDAANQANQAKSDFLANMSHEIRTPMNGVLGMAELLSHTELKQDQRSFLDMIQQSAKSLLRIINDILDFSKIEAGKLDLEATDFDLRECVRHVAKSLAVRASEKNLKVTLEIDDALPKFITGDPVRLRQVLVNLVGNAIKFTDNGQIAILVSQANLENLKDPSSHDGLGLQFAVQDSGIGIPKSKQKQIFEAFSQADVSTTRQYGGTGLGLTISSQLVHRMGGKMWLESVEGEGSTFFFTASFQIPQESPKQTAVASQAAAPKDQQPLEILLAEDGLVNRAVMLGALESRGHTVTSADDGQEAIEKWRDQDFDLIFMDMQMPVLDGIEATRQIRAEEVAKGLRPTQIVAVTAAAMASDYDRCIEAGMDSYLSKPLDFDKLDQMLVDVGNRKNLET